MFFLLACADERAARPPTEEVSWSGYVYVSPGEATDETQFSDGSVYFLPEGGGAVPATQPYPDYPGYWTVALPRDVPTAIHIAGPTLYPSIWAADAPHASGQWFPGALFGASRTFVDEWFTALRVEGIQPFEDGVVHVWGRPYDPTVWECAAIRVNDLPVACFVEQEDGTMVRVNAGLFDSFYAFNLAPGEIRVDGGNGIAEIYDAVGGELVYAFWLGAGEDG